MKKWIDREIKGWLKNNKKINLGIRIIINSLKYLIKWRLWSWFKWWNLLIKQRCLCKASSVTRRKTITQRKYYWKIRNVEQRNEWKSGKIGIKLSSEN